MDILAKNPMKSIHRASFLQYIGWFLQPCGAKPRPIETTEVMRIHCPTCMRMKHQCKRTNWRWKLSPKSRSCLERSDGFGNWDAILEKSIIMATTSGLSTDLPTVQLAARPSSVPPKTGVTGRSAWEFHAVEGGQNATGGAGRFILGNDVESKNIGKISDSPRFRRISHVDSQVGAQERQEYNWNCMFFL